MADMENGLWAGNQRYNPNNTPLTYEFVTAMVKGGENWRTFMLKLQGRRSRAKVLIVLQTKAFYESKPCLEEVNAALKAKCLLIPVRYEEDLPTPKEQWALLKEEDEELMIMDVQQKFNVLNSFPPRGTIFDFPNTMQGVLEKVKERISH